MLHAILSTSLFLFFSLPFSFLCFSSVFCRVRLDCGSADLTKHCPRLPAAQEMGLAASTHTAALIRRSASELPALSVWLSSHCATCCVPELDCVRYDQQAILPDSFTLRSPYSSFVHQAWLACRPSVACLFMGLCYGSRIVARLAAQWHDCPCCDRCFVMFCHVGLLLHSRCIMISLACCDWHPVRSISRVFVAFRLGILCTPCV